MWRQQERIRWWLLEYCANCCMVSNRRQPRVSVLLPRDTEVSALRGNAAFFPPGAVVQASVREEKKLMVENAKLRNDIEELKKQLLEKERLRGGTRGNSHCGASVCLSLTWMLFPCCCHSNNPLLLSVISSWRCCRSSP